jgi:hypothetical protein
MRQLRQCWIKPCARGHSLEASRSAAARLLLHSAYQNPANTGSASSRIPQTCFTRA